MKHKQNRTKQHLLEVAIVLFCVVGAFTFLLMQQSNEDSNDDVAKVLGDSQAANTISFSLNKSSISEATPDSEAELRINLIDESTGYSGVMFRVTNNGQCNFRLPLKGGGPPGLVSDAAVDIIAIHDDGDGNVMINLLRE